jgi:hypothetical protein
MTIPPPAYEPSVRFVPSRVEGASGVSEVAIFPNRLEVRGERGWVTVPFADVATGGEKRGLFNPNPHRGRVARNYFSRERYADSHIRFLTDPPITIYMPAEGPTHFPDSVFWRIQQTILSGGYQLTDGDDPPPKLDPLEGLPRRARQFVDGFGGVAVLNFLLFCVIGVCIGGDALNGKTENGRYFLSMNGRITEVSRGLWLYSRYHAISTLVLWVTAFIVIGGAHVYADACRRRDRGAPAGVSAPPR